MWGREPLQEHYYVIEACISKREHTKGKEPAGV